MKKIFFLIILLTSLLPAARELTLGQAVDLSLQQNHDLKSSKYRVRQLKLEKKEAFSKYFPRIDATGVYTHLNDSIDLNLDPLRNLLITLETSGTLADLDLQSIMTRGTPLTSAEKSAYSSMIQWQLNSAIPSLNMHVLDQDIFRITIDFMQPIWMGGRLRALNRSADLKHLSGTQDLLLTREKVIEETVRIYFLNKLLEDVHQVYQEVEKGISGHLERAESLYQAGLIARYQLTRAQVAFSEAQTNSLNARADLDTARSVLKNLLQLESSEKVKLLTPLPCVPMSKSSEQWESAILQNNATLEKIRLGRKLAHQKFRADLGSYLPQVFAFGQYEILKSDLSLLDPEWRVGVGLKLNLFSSGEKVARIKKDKLLKKQVAEQENHVSSLLKKLGDKLYFSAVKEQHNLDRFPLRLEQADENLRLANSRFSSGLGISLEVVDAHLIRQKVLTEKLQSRYAYLSYQLKLNELSMNLTHYIKKLEENK